MLVPDEIRDCVVFLGDVDDLGNERVRGTAFFVARPINLGSSHNLSFSYLVTARHVIDGMKKRKRQNVRVRINFRDGEARWIDTDIDSWVDHPAGPQVDISVRRFLAEHSKINTKAWPLSSHISPERIERYEIGLGDEVFMAGLFSSHHGRLKNIPIIRIGNIAAMPEEPIKTNVHGVEMEMEAYLIEARSIGGLSGSPVFLHMGWWRKLKDKPIATVESDFPFYLLGVMHGHWDLPVHHLDEITEDSPSLTPQRVNMGIAIVTPVSKLLEALEVFEDAEIKETELIKEAIGLLPTADEAV